MPDMSHEGVHQFWKEYQDPTIYRVIAFMEAVEEWTQDGNPDLEEAMRKLGEKLDEAGNYELGKEEEFIKIAGHIKSGRSLRLLQAMDTVHPGAASKLLIYSEENSHSSDDASGLFLRRNIVFERLRLLSRVFAVERFELVIRALEREDA